MGYEIRTLDTLATQARQFFVQSVSGALVRIWANTFRVFGKVFALLDFEHELRRQWLFRQLFASTADQLWLQRHGFELGLTPDAGNVATGTITVAAASGVVPGGLQFARADGLTYTTLAPGTASGGTVDLPVSADDVGALGNTDSGSSLSLVGGQAVPIGLGTDATVDAGGLAGGADPEENEAFRARVLYRKRNIPQGGAAIDYVDWTQAALASVSSVYVDSFQNDSRSVWVCFTVNDQPFGIPSAGEVAVVQAYVNDPIRRPVTARVFATAPNPVSVPVAITHFYPDTPDTREAVVAELAALQLDDVQPATPSTPFVLYREQIDAAIARASGVKHFTLTTPASDVTYSTGGDMPVLSAPTYS